ncbi:MAG: NAD-dependent epimerase/dehydratase family protein [Burkholderiaceae bacterium]
MRTLVTGAAGYLGRALTAALVEAGTSGLILSDSIHPAAPAGSEPITGDIGDPALHNRLFAEPVDTVFHLAGVVSGAAEADCSAGKHVNLDATIALLEHCRLQAERGGPVACFIYASSIAVFGMPLPSRIDDTTAPAPTLSYGAHKRACELLIDDCTRRGYIDGRALRLSGVVVRPVLPNGALSGFNSDLIREPLAGRAYTCPVGPDATIWIASLQRTIANLLRFAAVEGPALGAQRAVTMPSLAVAVRTVVSALGRVDPAAAARVGYAPQAALETQFGRWPLDCQFARARTLGLEADVSLDALIRNHLETR